MPSLYARRFCFTLNNPSTGEELAIAEASSDCKYLVVGRERAPTTGTKHLQGFVIFENKKTFQGVKNTLGIHRAHLEVARGTSEQAANYCKKEGDFDEYGTSPVPSKQGKRTDWDQFREFVQDQARVPTDRELAEHFLPLFARYGSRLKEIAANLLPPPRFVDDDAEPRMGFQHLVAGRMFADTPNPRTIDFVIDPQGNSGKSWLCQFALTRCPEKVQCLSVGKRDDLTYMIDASKSVFLFDVPRGQMEFFQYSVLEQLKNRIIFRTSIPALSNSGYCAYVAVFR